jgi:SAM-dependent methyltransferase
MVENRHWSDDDQFWEAVQPFLFTDQHMEVASVQVEKVLNLMKPPPGAHFLDLCCGVGRHSTELGRRGYRVTGVDRTRRFLDTAVARAGAKKLDAEFVRDDMRTFRRPDSFDAIINLYTSFGYFDDPDDDRQILDNIFHSLRSGGNLLMELEGKEILAKKFQPRDWVERDGVLFLQEREPVDNWTYLKNRWILIKDGRVEEFHLRLRIYSAHELVSLLTSVGFDDTSVFGDLDGSPYDQNAQRMVVMARKR